MKKYRDCLGTSSKRVRTQASVIRKKDLNNTSAKYCFIENSEFSRLLWNLKMTLKNSEKT